MKKTLIILFFILFALPIPIALLGGFLSAIIVFAEIIIKFNFIGIFMGILGIVVGGTYPITYFYALINTWNRKSVSIKTFIPLFHCLIAAVFLIGFIYLSPYMGGQGDCFNFSISDFNVIKQYDDHGGFHGDGMRYIVLDCSENKEKAMENLEDWKRFPMTDNTNLIIYGGEKNGVYRSLNLAKEADMPEIKNGYYKFEDRHYESDNIYDDSEIFDRASYNFSVGIYDCDTNIMYYFDYDT